MGQSVDIKVRWKAHRTHLRCGKHHAAYFQHAWNKYGEAAFCFEVLEECAVDVLTEREQWWMDHLRPVFNVALAAGRASWTGRKHSPETIAKMREVHKGKKYALGVKHSAETCAKFSAAQKGITNKWTPEGRARIIAATKGRPLSPEHKAAISAYMTGRPKSAETRAKMAAAQRAKPVGPAGENAVKTHCKRGHPFDKENTRRTDDGRRVCRACARESMRARRAKRGPKPRLKKEPKTHCPHGHPYDEANTHVAADGRRSCRTCARDRAREKRAALP